MNRTGLIIALGLSLAIGLAFGLYPELDLKISAFFYDQASKTFPVGQSTVANFARNGAMVIAWGLAMPSIYALIRKLIWPAKPLILPGRKVVFIVVTIVLAAGVISNFGFKGHWGRPRPVAVTEFNGDLAFKPWWDPRGGCQRNCSFFSGEGATAFWTYAPATLAPPQWRPLAYAAVTVFGALTGGLRISFGGHFATDVLFSGLVTFIVIWLCHGFIFRWPRTATSEERIDTALTRFAWPGYRLRTKWLGRDVGPAPAAASQIRADETGARPREV